MYACKLALTQACRNKNTSMRTQVHSGIDQGVTTAWARDENRSKVSPPPDACRELSNQNASANRRPASSSDARHAHKRHTKSIAIYSPQDVDTPCKSITDRILTSVRPPPAAAGLARLQGHRMQRHRCDEPRALSCRDPLPQ